MNLTPSILYKNPREKRSRFLRARQRFFQARARVFHVVYDMLAYMRDPQVIEAELMEISGIQGDGTKFARIVAWCATHPDEVPFALHVMMGRVGVENKRAGDASEE